MRGLLVGEKDKRGQDKRVNVTDVKALPRGHTGPFGTGLSSTFRR
jgi:hypothetical protein